VDRVESHAWRIGCDRDGRVTAVAVTSGRARFVSGRSQADMARGSPLPNTVLCNTPSGAPSARKALAVALGPSARSQNIRTPTEGNGARDPESAGAGTISTNYLHSISDWSNFPVSTLSRRSLVLFDHLVGEGEEGGRHGQSEGLCGLEVDH
jgi:hypothetical protein